MDTPVLLTSNSTTTNVAGTTVNTASISPTSNKIIFVHVNITTYSGTPPAVSITANSLGLTWTAWGGVVHSDITNAVHYVFSGIGSSPSSGSIPLVVASGNSVARFEHEVVEIGANGSSNPIVQSSSHDQFASESPSDFSITAMSALASGSGTVAFWSRAGGTGSNQYTAQDSYTKLSETAGADGGIATTYKLAGTTSPRVTLTADFVRGAGMAFEIVTSTTGYTVTAESGSYALTGQATNFLKTSTLAFEQGSYSLTGQATTLVYGNTARTLTADVGLYTLVGSNALVDVSMNADQGSYTLSGQAVTLTFQGLTNPVLVADQGSYSLNGQSVNLLDGFKTFGDQGSYVLTGRQVGLFWSGAPVGSNASCRGMSITSLRIGL